MDVSKDGEWLCSTRLALTIYLGDMPGLKDILATWNVYRRLCPARGLRRVRNLVTPFWDELPPRPAEAAVLPYLEGLGKKIIRGLQVWDGLTSAESWRMTIERVPAVEGRPSASFCQILLPDRERPEVLHEAAMDLADRLQFLSGHGGFSCTFDPARKEQAFDQIYAWARRYVGLEVEDLNVTLPFVLDGVKGANWITLVGEPFLARLGLSRDGRRELGDSIRFDFCRYGGVIRAGLKPVWGDRNRQEFPTDYAIVERFVLPVKIREHPEFRGRFADEAATLPWLNRLTEPGKF